MNPRSFPRFALLLSTVVVAASAGAQNAPVEVRLVNPTFQNANAAGVPDGWKAGPGGNGSDTVIAANLSGGVKLTDNSTAVGLGLGQWIDVNAGDTYTAKADVEGTGSLQLYLMFVPKIPAQMGDLKKVMISEAHVSLPAKPGSPSDFTVTAPAGATKAQVWIYCPKTGKCDVVVKSISIKKTGAGPAPTPVASTAAAASSSKSASNTERNADGTPSKERNDAGQKNPLSIIKPGAVSVVDFETGDFSQTFLKQGGKMEVVNAPEPVRNGSHAMKVMLTHDQHRSEIIGLRSAAYGEFKYGWSIFLPKSFDGKTWFSIVSQWHSWGSGKIYTINPPGPPTCLVVANDRWKLLLRYQDGDSDNSIKKDFDIGPIDPDRDKWTDFVMEVNWQSPKSGGGYLRLWKNGQQVVNYEGPTWFEDMTSGPFFKMGIYKGGGTWKGEESGAVAYYDEFRMGDKSVPRDAVDPAKQGTH